MFCFKEIIFFNTYPQIIDPRFQFWPRCNTELAGEETLLAGACVLAGIITSLMIVFVVHCQKKMCAWWRCDKMHVCHVCQDTCSGDYCDKYSRSPRDTCDTCVEDNLYYTDRSRGLPSIPSLPDKMTELYYPSSTKSTYCEDDYFLSLSKDRKTFKPIRVCEL